MTAFIQRPHPHDDFTPRMVDDIYSWSGRFTDLAAPDQLAVAQLVVRAKAVVGTVDDLLARVTRTRCVALLRETVGDRIVAVAAWKQPAATYRRSNFTAAGAPIAGFESAPELGYVVIAPDMRGKQLSGGLVDAIVAQITEPTFATTDSSTMRNNLERSGFTQIGNEWQGKKGMLSLWTITP
jgi:predicted GNAT family N-acyltransferase